MENRLSSTPPHVRSKLVDLFGIDPRTLALSRMALAAVLLYNLATRARELRIMYSDRGMFPIADVARFWGPDSLRWSLHMLNGSTTCQAILFGVAAIFGIMLLLGFHTRLATVASWVLLASLHTRAPVLVTGGDILLLMMLFWGMFLPWGRRRSLDARGRGGEVDNAPILSVASAAILLQVAFMYLFTAASKCNYLWLEGKALGSVMQNPLFTRPLGQWLVGFPTFLMLLTYATLILELVGPPLMFCPWKTRSVRAIAVSCFVALHLGIELTMYVVIFSFASLAALTLFIPSTFWSRAWVRRLTLDRATLAGNVPTPATRASRPALRRVADVAIAIVGLVSLTHILIVNPLIYFGPADTIDKLPRWVNALREIGCFDQEWSMFACPATHNYRYVAVATLRNGQQVDVLRKKEAHEVEHPETLSLEPPTQRWVQIMVDLARPNRDIFRHSFTRFLAREWNAVHTGEQRIEHIQLAFIFERADADVFGSTVEKYVLAQDDPFATGVYEKGKREGHWVYYYPNGNKEAAGDYHVGTEQGNWTFWYEDGSKQGEGTYQDGELHGKWNFWYRGGQEVEKVEAFFHHGRQVPPPLTRSDDAPTSTP